MRFRPDLGGAALFTRSGGNLPPPSSGIPTRAILVADAWGAFRNNPRKNLKLESAKNGPVAHVGIADERGYPFSCASTTAIAAMLTMSLTSTPRCSTCTGLAMPWRIGPIASAPPRRHSNL